MDEILKFRPQRGGLKESMENCIHIKNSRESLETILKSKYPELVGKVTVEPYGYDERIKWNTHIVCVDGKAVGFTDGALKEEKPADYCEIGMSSCRCGWQGKYPVSGCPRCHHSFVE